MRHRYVVRFALDGDLRFISHHDTVRLFERALARAEWPVKFSEGFNPRPRLSLPLPRGVGIASDDELMVVELTEGIATGEALERLSRQMPAGIRLLGATEHAAKAAPAPRRAWYEGQMESAPADLDRAIDEALKRTSIVVTRAGQDGAAGRNVDIRPYIAEIIRRDNRLEMALFVTPEGSARPAEVLAALGLAEQILPHRLRRTRVEWSNLEANGDEPAAPTES